MKMMKKKVTLDMRKAYFVSVELLADGTAIQIDGEDKTIGLVISKGMAKELVRHLTAQHH